MKVINVTDIEDLISAKLEIDSLLLSHKDIEKKIPLNEYMEKYCNLSNAYSYKGDIIPFAYYNIYGNQYLYIAQESDNIDKLIEKLKAIDFDLSNLKEITNIDIIEKFETYENAEYFIINNKYYNV